MRNEGCEQQIAEWPVIEQQRAQRIPLHGDVAQRPPRERRHEHGLARQQIHLAEELRGAVSGDLVARGIQDGDLTVNDRDEWVITIPDLVEDIAGVGRPLLADLGERGQLGL